MFNHEIPGSFGVDISGHAIETIDLSLMRVLGVSWVRKRILWTGVEPAKRGAFDFLQRTGYRSA